MTVRPVRLQLSHRAGFNLQAHSRAVNGLPAVNVARPGKWGNPYRIGDPKYRCDAIGRPRPVKGGLTAADVVARFRRALMHDGARSAEIIRDLRGRNLACWCKPGAPCHADILLELANNDLR